MPGTIKHELGFTISGKCVISSTFVTLTPAASKLDAVPPVEIIENLQEHNLCISGKKLATFDKKNEFMVHIVKHHFFLNFFLLNPDPKFLSGVMLHKTRSLLSGANTDFEKEQQTIN